LINLGKSDKRYNVYIESQANVTERNTMGMYDIEKPIEQRIEASGETWLTDPYRVLEAGFRMYNGSPYKILTADQIQECIDIYLPRNYFDVEKYCSVPPDNQYLFDYRGFPSREAHRRSEITARILISKNLKGEN
jgi:hypothetical protein